MPDRRRHGSLVSAGVKCGAPMRGTAAGAAAALLRKCYSIRCQRRFV